MNYTVQHVPDYVLKHAIEQLEAYGKLLKTIESAGFIADAKQAFGFGLLSTINTLREISDRPTIAGLD